MSSLLGALQTGKSALAVQQAALQVTGNNIANAGNADYTRQTALVQPSRDQQFRPGMFIGTGVDLTGIQRQIDEALNSRICAAVSDNQSADTTQQWLGRVESVFNELGDQDLSTEMSKFFNSWSDLANKPQDVGLRQVVLQNGQSLASKFKGLRTSLGNIQTDVDDRLRELSTNADGLAQKIADLNEQVIKAEGGSVNGAANGLRDQRDAAVKQLSELLNVNTVEEKGVLNVYVGSEPLVIGNSNLGVALKSTTDDKGGPMVEVVFKNNNGTMNVTSGEIGALVGVRKEVAATVDKTDALANNLIFELNKLHGSGQGLEGFSAIATTSVARDPALALNNPDAGYKFAAKNGSFVVHVKQKGTGLTTSTLVQVDLDGLNSNDTSLNSLAASLDAVGGISASINAGRMTVKADSSDVEVSFSQDTSGALAALGVNNFFTGSDARDIAVNANLQKQPTLLAASKNGNAGDNQTALAIAALQGAKLTGLTGQSLKDSYQAMINSVSVDAATAKSNAEAAKTVSDTLSAQREALSGVSLDEEAINLIRQQRAFQAAGRLISAVDEMMRTLLSIT